MMLNYKVRILQENVNDKIKNHLTHLKDFCKNLIIKNSLIVNVFLTFISLTTLAFIL